MNNRKPVFSKTQQKQIIDDSCVPECSYDYIITEQDEPAPCLFDSFIEDLGNMNPTTPMDYTSHNTCLTPQMFKMRFSDTIKPIAFELVPSNYF
jgi:hypothetical protein